MRGCETGGWEVAQVAIIFPRPGQVAQLVEQGTENPRVGGSIPSLAIAQGPVSSGLSSFVSFRFNPCVRPGIIELMDRSVLTEQELHSCGQRCGVLLDRAGIRGVVRSSITCWLKELTAGRAMATGLVFIGL